LQGRYSVVGAHPSMEVVAKENKVAIIDHVAETLTERTVDDPVMIPREISEGWKPYLIDELPDAFCGKDSLTLHLPYDHALMFT